MSLIEMAAENPLAALMTCQCDFKTLEDDYEKGATNFSLVHTLVPTIWRVIGRNGKTSLSFHSGTDTRKSRDATRMLTVNSCCR